MPAQQTKTLQFLRPTASSDRLLVAAIPRRNIFVGMEGNSGAVRARCEATPRVANKRKILDARHVQFLHAFLHVHVLPPALPAHTLANADLLLVYSNCRS